MGYQVLTAENKTIIVDTDSDLRVNVGDKPVSNTAYCLATLYQIKGGFVPEKVYVFQTDGMDLEALKKAVDFFFTTLLETELYVKEVPRESALFEQEARRLYGTVSVVCNSRAEQGAA